MTHLSKNGMFLLRVTRCRAFVQTNTQRIRSSLLKKLEELFDLANVLARDKNISLPDRNKWVRVAAFMAQTISCVANSFDEQLINKNLNKLERFTCLKKT